MTLQIPVLSTMHVIAMILADVLQHLHTHADAIPVHRQETMADALPLSGFYFFCAAAAIMVLLSRTADVVWATDAKVSSGSFSYFAAAVTKTVLAAN